MRIRIITGKVKLRMILWRRLMLIKTKMMMLKIRALMRSIYSGGRHFRMVMSRGRKMMMLRKMMLRRNMMMILRMMRCRALMLRMMRRKSYSVIWSLCVKRSCNARRWLGSHREPKQQDKTRLD